MTYDELMQSIMDRIPDSLDKREGAIIYDAVAPVAMELAIAYTEMERILNEGFADTASMEYLIKRAKERDITPYQPTRAILKMETTPPAVNVPIGARFSLSDLNYVVIEKVTDGEYRVECEAYGSEGNGYFGVCVPINYIDGLETCEITDLVILQKI